ncbi:MAG: hypothetical protein ACI9YB_003054, partial [Halioglobus sp.]
WIEDYESLKANLPVNEAIYFIGGVHPSHSYPLIDARLPQSLAGVGRRLALFPAVPSSPDSKNIHNRRTFVDCAL